ncbi:MAG: hypothetical protein WC716_13885 [Chitinophagaceae bacterium]|jgi:hypothetical protein
MAWPNNHKKTEAIWQLLWDAKERLDIFDSHSEVRYFDDLFSTLKRLERCFYDCFGKGVYLSPVMIVKRANCNICGINIKACEHIPGHLYNGIPCKELIVDMIFEGVDIVQSPFDMRCRIWSWNFTDDMNFTGRILNLNRLDSFIDE